MSCPDCFRGHDHHGPISGTETVMYGLNTYVTSPPKGSDTRSENSIVIFSDAFGWATVNLRKVADTYARRTGCKVYLPDFMYGTAAPPWVKINMDRIDTETGLWAYIMKPILFVQAVSRFLPFIWRNKPVKRYPLMKEFMASLRNDLPTQTRVGVASFCWGAYGATHLAQECLTAENGAPLVDAVFTAHPSEITAEDFRTVKIPYCLVIGDVDFAMKIEQVREAADILAANKAVQGEVMVIPKARHGFAVRGNPDDPIEKEYADAAEDKAVQWFQQHL